MIAKVTPKNIPDIWEDEQEPIRKYITSQLKEIENTYPEMRLVVLDAYEFYDDLWGERTKPGVEVSYDNDCKCIKFAWEDKLIVKFFGNGKWHYEAILKDGHLVYEGMGHLWRDESLYEKDSSPYLFAFNNKHVKNLCTLKDEFMNVYEPMYKWPRNSDLYNIEDWVHVVWTTDKYDGMLSGYCKLNHELYYVEWVEETTFTKDRMYALYKLNSWDKIFAYFQHYTFTFLVNHRISSLRYKTRELWHGKKWYQVLREKRDAWCKRHEIIGYFSSEDL